MEKKSHLLSFYVAGFSYYEGCLIFDQLKIGTELKLIRDSENRYDPDAVAIYFNETKIGFVPQQSNAIISKFLDQGYNNIFEIRCNRVNPEANPEHQVGVVVFLKNNINI